MVSGFPNFSRSHTVDLEYSYLPLTALARGVATLQKEAEGDYLKAKLIAAAQRLRNRIICGLSFGENDVELVCQLCRQVDGENQRLIHNAAKHLLGGMHYQKVIEYIVYTMDFPEFAFVYRSEESLEFVKESIADPEVWACLVPISYSQLSNSYTDLPLITFVPAIWDVKLTVIPSSPCQIFVRPSFIPQNSNVDNWIQSPVGAGLGVNSPMDAPVRERYEVEVPSEVVASLNRGESDDELLFPLDASVAEILVDKLEVRDVFGNAHRLLAHKEYTVINADGVVDYIQVDSVDDLLGVHAIVDSFDTAELGDNVVARANHKLMARWKGPLADGLAKDRDALVSALVSLGSLKANVHNISHWASPNNIAPGSDEDYRAVLTYANIGDESEIRDFIGLARKLRGDAIKQGHEKSEIVDFLVKDHLKGMLKRGLEVGQCVEFDGIKIEIIILRTGSG